VIKSPRKSEGVRSPIVRSVSDTGRSIANGQLRYGKYKRNLLRPSESESLLMYRSTGSSEVDESIILRISARQWRTVIMGLLSEMLDD